MSVKYCGGCSVHRGDNIGTVKGIQYCGGVASVLCGITAVHVGIASVQWGYLQYCGGCSVLHQYSGGGGGGGRGEGGGDSVLLRVFRTLGDTFSTCGG